MEKTHNKYCIGGFCMILAYTVFCSVCLSLSANAGYMAEVYTAPVALIGVGLCIVGLKNAREAKALSVGLGITGIVLFVQAVLVFICTAFLVESVNLLSQLSSV